MDSLFDCGVVVCDGIGGLLDCLDCISGFDLDIEGPVHELGVLVDVPDDGHVFIVVECLDKGGDEGTIFDKGMLSLQEKKVYFYPIIQRLFGKRCLLLGW